MKRAVVTTLIIAALGLSAFPAVTASADPAVNEALAVMKDYGKAMRAGDVDALMALHSDDWVGMWGFTKSSLEDDFQELVEEGGYEDTEIDLDDAEVIVDGDTVTFAPVTIKSSAGSYSVKRTLKKEDDGVWRFVKGGRADIEEFQPDGTGPRMTGEDGQATPGVIARALRERILSDPSRPGYHFVNPEGIGMPFDPNGAIYWKGRYHMFYIFQDSQLGEKSDHWGHMSSTDLFHWRHHPTDLLEGMYSGNCFINKDGQPTICYHQVGQGNAMAVALDDDLDEWKKLDSNPITPKTRKGGEHYGKYRSWDPFGWLEGDTYYAIFGGGRPGIAKSPTLAGEWKYVGDLLAHGVEGVSPKEDVSCAELFELDGKDVLLCLSHRLGCRYYIGEWKDEQFYPESHGQMSWVDNSFFAPESLVDDKGRRIMWAWIFDEPDFGVRSDHGWSGTMSLPRVLSLDDNGQLLIDVPEEIKALRYGAVKKKNLTVSSGVELSIDDIGGNSFELILDMESAEATQFGVKVCVSPDGEEETVIFYDATEGKLKVDTRKSGPEDTPKTIEAGPFELKNGERLKLRIFVDKSVVEVFANSRQAVMRRIYPSRADSVGVRLFSTGGETKVHALEAYNITPSNPY